MINPKSSDFPSPSPPSNSPGNLRTSPTASGSSPASAAPLSCGIVHCVTPTGEMPLHQDDQQPVQEEQIKKGAELAETPESISDTEAEKASAPQPAADLMRDDGLQYLQPPEPTTPGFYLALPSLTPSKSTGSTSSSSPPESISDDDGGFLEHESDHENDDGDEPNHDQLDALSLVDPTPPTSSSTTIKKARQHSKKKPAGPGPCATPAHPSSQTGNGSRSEPGPARRSIGRKRSVSGLVALRYRTSGQIDSDQRGMLALDLDAYINSSDNRDGATQKPSAALSPAALFPTLLNRPTTVLPRRSEWVVGTGTGPGNAHRGFIPGVLSDSS